jgi:hypothetical protein
VAAAAIASAGCFAPTPQPGLPCSDDGRCPAGLTCDPSTSTCVATPGIDAGGDGGGSIDGTSIDGGPLGWSTPVALSSINSTSGEADASMTADGLELFFVSSRTGSLGELDIFRASRADPGDPFGNVVHVPGLSTPQNDDSPWISPDGLTIYFTSDRSGVENQVFIATRPDRMTMFAGATVELGLSLGDELNIALSADMLVAVVDRPTGTADRELYQHTRANLGAAWSGAVHLASLGSTGTDASPGLDATGLTIYFHSDRDGPQLDPQRAHRAAITEPFDPPVNLPELDLAGFTDGNPFITADERTIFFDSNRPGGLGGTDLYMATR